MPNSRRAARRARRPASSRGRQAERAKPARRTKPVTAAEAAAWYHGKNFTFDWTSWHFPNWFRLLRKHRDRRTRVLEIGSWEGRSALFFLNYLPRARVTCVDTFAGGKEHQAAAARTKHDARMLHEVERRFDANTAGFRHRIEKIKAQSTDALLELGIRNRRFDIAYIDGGHRAVEVYGDGMLAWPLMERGGLVIFDDYLWKEDPVRLDNPGPGIDAFLKAIDGQYRIVLDSYQIGIVKR